MTSDRQRTHRFTAIIGLLLVFFLTASSATAQSEEPAPAIDVRASLPQPKIKIGLWSGMTAQMVRIQAQQGNWQAIFYPAPPASVTGSLLSQETVSRLPEGEHLTLDVVARGILARTSSGQEFPAPRTTPEGTEIPSGYGHIEISGGELFSVEIPDRPIFVFSGKLEVTLQEGSLVFFLTQDLEDYLLSTVSEFCPSSEPEAIKAHQVVARTFATYTLIHPRHATESFHVCDTPHCLAFRGMAKNRELVHTLAPETRDEVLLKDGKIFFPYFQSACAGKLSSAKDIYDWDDGIHLSKNDRAEEKGAENCFHSPSFDWTREFTKEEMTDFLAITYAGGGTNIFYDWEPIRVDPAGRITLVKIRGKHDKVVPGVEFLRHLQAHFGPNSFRSSRFEVKPRNRTVIFKGKGQGEGVGFCQYGSDGLARKGWDYKKILSFYYAGISIARAQPAIPAPAPEEK